jgi:hypothetical protein
LAEVDDWTPTADQKFDSTTVYSECRSHPRDLQIRTATMLDPPAKIDAFISYIRAQPEFVSAVSTDSKWSDQLLDTVEQGIAAVCRDPELVETFDKILAVIDHRDFSIKQRLDKIGSLLTPARDAGRSVH